MVLVRQFRCGFEGCNTSYANKRNNMERHVWTRHVREMLHFKPHVRYIANYHKCHVDKYVCMYVVEEDDVSLAAPTESSAQSSGYYSHSSASSGYDPDSPSTVSSPLHSSDQPLRSNSLPNGFNVYLGHSTPSSAGRVRGDQSPYLSDTSEDEGLATPPHVLLMRMKTGRSVHATSLESPSSFPRSKSYRHEPYPTHHHRPYSRDHCVSDAGHREHRPLQSPMQELWRPW